MSVNDRDTYLDHIMTTTCRFGMDDGGACGRRQDKDGFGPYCSMHAGQFERDVYERSQELKAQELEAIESERRSRDMADAARWRGTSPHLWKLVEVFDRPVSMGNGHTCHALGTISRSVCALRDEGHKSLAAELEAVQHALGFALRAFGPGGAIREDATDVNPKCHVCGVPFHDEVGTEVYLCATHIPEPKS